MLRHVFHDPIRRCAASRGARRKLGLAELTPPELRRAGRGDATAWAFGIFAGDWVPQRKPKKPARVDALAKYKLPLLKTVGDVRSRRRRRSRSADARGHRPGLRIRRVRDPKAKGGTRRIAAPRRSFARSSA
jgi:hypothetical protein